MLRVRLFIYILTAVSMAFIGCKADTLSSEKSRRTDIASISRKLAVVSPAFLSKENEAERQSTHGSIVQFSQNGTSIAYVEPVGKQFRVVHNGKAGKPYNEISELIISSDGKRVAYIANINDRLNRVVLDGREGLPYGADNNHWFTPDGKHHLSTVTEGDTNLLVIDNKVSHDYRINDIVMSPDSLSLGLSIKVQDANNRQFVITDISLQNKTVFDSCGWYILPSDDQSLLAVGCKEGEMTTIKIIDFANRTVITDVKYDGLITHMRFSPHDNALSYTYLINENQKYVVYNGKEEKIPAGDEFLTDPVVLSEPESVGVIIGDIYKQRFYRAFQTKNKNGKIYGYISDLVSSKDGRHYAYIATKPNEVQMQIVVDGYEGPKFDRIVSPIFSPDNRFLVCRARQEGKRFVVVFDMKGRIIKQHKDYDMVFQPVFTADGTSLAYGVLDGNEFWWKVEKLGE